MYIMTVALTVTITLLGVSVQCVLLRPSLAVAERSDAAVRQHIREQIVRAVAWRTALAKTADTRQRLPVSTRSGRLHCSTRAHAILHSLNVLCSAVARAR